MSYCKNCGADVGENKFCANCGTAVTETVTGVSTTPTNTYSDYYAQICEYARNATSILVFGILSLVCCMGIGLIFEINTGAIGRGYRTVPYPSEEILHVIRECGGKITYSSDCHNASAIAIGFEDSVALAKKCGFKSFMKLGADGFYEEKF